MGSGIVLLDKSMISVYRLFTINKYIFNCDRFSANRNGRFECATCPHFWGMGGLRQSAVGCCTSSH